MLGRVDYYRHVACMTMVQCELMVNADESTKSMLSKKQFEEVKRRGEEEISNRLKRKQDQEQEEEAQQAQQAQQQIARGAKKKSKKDQDEKENDDDEFDFRQLIRRAPLPGAKKALAPKPARTALDYFRAHLFLLKEQSNDVPEAELEKMFVALAADERRQFVAKATRDAKRFATQLAKWKEEQ